MAEDNNRESKKPFIPPHNDCMNTDKKENKRLREKIERNPKVGHPIEYAGKVMIRWVVDSIRRRRMKQNDENAE